MNTAPLVYDISGSYDAFARLRVSNPQTLFDCKLLYDKQPFLWDDMRTSGSGTNSVFNSNQASVTLSVSSNVAGTHVRQTFQRFIYQPGKSQFIMMTGVLGSNVAGVTKRLGCFDSNNGLFFQVGPGADDMYVVKRSSVSGVPVDTRVAQSDWNKNKLNSPDLITYDKTKANIYYFNYEWLGVGDIFYGVMLGGKAIPVHQLYNANQVDTVTFSLPNLPLRYEISNNGTGKADSITCICSTVLSEGGQQNIGYIFSIDRLSASLSISATGVIYPILAIRLAAGRTAVNVFLEGINIIATNPNVVFRWSVLLNPTISGTPLTWSAVSVSSCVEASNTSTTATTVTGGILLSSGYGIGTDANIQTSTTAARFSLGTSIAGVSDIIVLGLERLDNQTDTFYASMAFREIV